MTKKRLESLRTAVLAVAGAALAAALAGTAAIAAGEAPAIERQPWTFAGVRGRFDRNQLQRGFQVYKEVCATCHGVKRLSFRNLAESGGPEFPEEGVKNLASTYQVVDGPNDQGKMFKRPGKLSDAIPSPFSNEQEARAAQNGALPPDLSVITKARAVEVERPFYAVPFAMARDISRGYQEGGADYVYALLTGYAAPPAGTQLTEGMHYNRYFPGHQIAMANPFAGGDGVVKYGDGTPATVQQYAKDVTAFLAWAGDPHLEGRKRMGLVVLLYLAITAVLAYLAKKKIWSRLPH